MTGEERRDEPALEERSLHAALRGLRVERGAFRDGVERRIVKVRARREAEAREAARSPFLRTAAAMLPAGLLRGEMAAIASWSAGWKALPALLLWPALTFAMAGLWIGVALFGAGGMYAPPIQGAVAAWWRAHRGKAVATLALIALLFTHEPGAAVVGGLLISAGVLVLGLARLRAAGFGDRASVARNAAIFLQDVFWVLLFLEVQAVSELLTGARTFSSPTAAWSSLALLGVGALACTGLALGGAYQSPWRFLVRSGALDSAVWLLALLQLPFAVLALYLAVDHASRREPAARLEMHLGAVGPKVAHVPWGIAADAAEWLREQGREPEWKALRARWRHALETRSGDALLAAGLRLGFATEAEVASALRAGRVEGELQLDGPFALPSLRDRPEVLLLVRRDLTASEREHLRRRLLASFDALADPAQTSVLQRAADTLHVLELLEHGASARLAERVQELLTAAWLPARPFARRAGFRASAEHRIAYVPEMHGAIDLMRRSGVPAGVDLEELADTLAAEAEPPFPWLRVGWNNLEALTALDKLRAELAPLPARRRVLDQSLVLAVALLVGSCVTAALCAPRASA